jgi:hypothetical protein
MIAESLPPLRGQAYIATGVFQDIWRRRERRGHKKTVTIKCRQRMEGITEKAATPLIERHRLKIEKRATALGPPELHAGEGIHGDAPGEAGQEHDGCTDDRIGPIR